MVWGIKTSSGNSCDFIMTRGILVLHPGIKPVPPAMEGEDLTTGPPGKSSLETSRVEPLGGGPGKDPSPLNV